MLIRVQPIEEKSLWERMIEDRCREWIYELESTDDDVQLTELVERIVARLSGSPKAMSIFLEVEAEMRRTELGAGERLLANATLKELVALVGQWRRGAITRQARDHICAACEGGPLAFSVAPHLRTQ